VAQRRYGFRPRTPSSSLAHVLWLDDAARVAPFSWTPLTESRSSDVVIVGGGYTGLWTALSIRQWDPGARVCLLEGDLCGSGASGRNGGFAVGWWSKIGSLTKALGAQDGVSVARLVSGGVDTIEETFQARGIDVHFQRGGWLWTASSPAQADAWKSTVAAAERVGVKAFEVLDADEIARRTGSPTHVGGVLDASGGTVHPGLLVRALRAAAIAAGVEVFERSPVAEVTSGDKVRVRTQGGSVVTADRCVLALNAWMAHLDAFRQSTVVVSSDMIATEPVPELLDAIGWRGGEGISDSHLMLNYLIRTRDGRVAFGRGGGTLAWNGHISASFEHSPPQQRILRQHLIRLLPALRDARVTHAWAGAVDRTMSGLPYFGSVGKDARVFAGIGYSGTGVAPCVAGGKMLAATVLGATNEWTDAAAALRRVQSGRLPPEPIRYLGGLIVQGAVARKERAEDEGRRPPPFTRTIARFVPGGVIDR
jgi:glycine/D-amino acid oxidase-like deaminating enzyme